jgi:hypothetical protein
MEAFYGSTPPTEVRVTDVAKRPPGGREGAARRAYALDSGLSNDSGVVAIATLSLSQHLSDHRLGPKVIRIEPNYIVNQFKEWLT